MRREPAARTLVTGATGFIGRAVTRRLLASGERVTVLARARDGQSAAGRVKAALEGAPGADLDIVEGDLDRPAAGLGAADVTRLRATVETVIHCAGEAIFFPEHPERFRAGHVEGPASLLGALANGRLRTWAQLSTAYVCGRRSGTVLEGDGDMGQDFHNPYERVKLEAEIVLRATGRRHGIDVRVFRPSAVVGLAPDTAGGSPANLFSEFIRMAAALGRARSGAHQALRIIATRRARFNIVPVGYVARSLCALARCPDGAGETFHLVVADPPRQEAMLRMIAERLCVRDLALIDPGRAGPAAARPPAGASPLERRLHFRLERYRDYLHRDVHFDDTNARRVLARHGLAPATLAAADVGGLIEHALRGRSDASSRMPRARRVRPAGTESGDCSP